MLSPDSDGDWRSKGRAKLPGKAIERRTTVKIQDLSRRSLGFAPLLASGMLLSGCMGSPTYGTGTPSDVQLFEDVTGMLSLAPKNDEQIAYKPRPELVKPASTDVLPAPQENVATAANPAWPESPEQRRTRLRAEATAGRDNPDFEPLIDNDVASVAPRSQPRNHRWEDVAASTSPAQREEFNRRVAVAKQGSPTARRYLSEPPLDYRQPAATAPADDIGEDEWTKEKRLKREARKNAGKRSWRDNIPWL